MRIWGEVGAVKAMTSRNNRGGCFLSRHCQKFITLY